MELDDLHYKPNRIDGANKEYNFILSAREDGKSTSVVASKANKAFREEKRPSILVKRMIADITDGYIESQEKILRKFWGIKGLTYKRGSMKEGIVYVNDMETGLPRYVIVALNTPLPRLKSHVIENPKYFFFDEFMINTRAGEKYLKNEVFKFKEIYSTFYREASDSPKCYFTGNPYSFYNPFFSEFGIEPRRGNFQIGTNWAFEYHPLDPRLIEKIKEKNPLFAEDNEYSRYALGGQPINDSNVRIVEKCPQFFSLWAVATIDSKRLGIFVNTRDNINEDMNFWVGHIGEIGSRRNAVVFDFKDLAQNTVLFSATDRLRFLRLKIAMQRRAVGFQDMECDYLIEEIYGTL